MKGRLYQQEVVSEMAISGDGKMLKLITEGFRMETRLILEMAKLAFLNVAQKSIILQARKRVKEWWPATES